MRLWFLLGALLANGLALASSPEERGLAIAKQVELNDSGFGDYVTNAYVEIKSPDGVIGYRRFEMTTLEVENDGDKRLVVFSEPRDLAGFVTLTYSHGLEPDDQWIYLPAIRRTKRLAARDKTGSFVGSEFAYEDIGTWELKKYTYRHLGDEPCPEQPSINCHVVEDIPSYPYSGYTRLIEWINPNIWQPVKIIFHDRADRPLKELYLRDYRQYGTFWRPHQTEMVNVQTGAISTIKWSDYRFGTGVSESHFSPRSLRRWSQ